MPDRGTNALISEQQPDHAARGYKANAHNPNNTELQTQSMHESSCRSTNRATLCYHAGITTPLLDGVDSSLADS